MAFGIFRLQQIVPGNGDDGRPPPVLELPEDARKRERSISERVLMRVWDSFGKHGEERSFLLKIDAFLLYVNVFFILVNQVENMANIRGRLYIVLSYLIKTLDSTNISMFYYLPQIRLRANFE